MASELWSSASQWADSYRGSQGVASKNIALGATTPGRSTERLRWVLQRVADAAKDLFWIGPCGLRPTEPKHLAVWDAIEVLAALEKTEPTPCSECAGAGFTHELLGRQSRGSCFDQPACQADRRPCSTCKALYCVRARTT